MGRRRRSRPKNPRRGPGHNEQNRQNRESRQTAKMLDGSQETRFRYFLEEILIEQNGMQPENARPFIQQLWTQGNRNSTDEAKVWLRTKVDEGVVDKDTSDRIVQLINRYSRYR
jgi:hypothetical protein